MFSMFSNMFLAIDGSGRTIEEISIPDTLMLSLIGILIVFGVLIVIMAIIKLTTSVVEAFEKSGKKEEPSPVAPVVIREETKANSGKVPAIGSLGECLLYTTDDQTAAMLMAIVADDLKAPLNELRFISIKEV